MSNAAWALKAKLNGYPLCPSCREPIPKSDWKAFEKRGVCVFCSNLIERTDWRDRIDQGMSHLDRHCTVVFYEI